MSKRKLVMVVAVPFLLWIVASLGPRTPTEMPPLDRDAHSERQRSAEPHRTGTRPPVAATIAPAAPEPPSAEPALVPRTQSRTAAPEPRDGSRPSEPLDEAAPAVAAPSGDVSNDHERMQKRLHERWATESDDAEWSSRVGLLVGQAIADGQIKGSLRAAQCRTTLCRLQLAFDSAQEASKLAELIEDPNVPKQLFWSQEDDRLVLEVYTVRDATRQLEETL